MADTGGGDSGIPILGPILDVLGSIFGGQSQVQELSQAIDQVEQAVWTNALGVASWAFGDIGGILDTLGKVLGSLGKLLGNLFGNIIWGFIKKIFEAIKDWITNLRNWIRVHIAAWQQIQRQLDQARSQYFRKIIDLIQRIRKILVPFRLLHLKFAQQLDATLAGFESDLGQKWAALIKHNNQVLGVLNDIIDPSQLLRPGHMLGSVGLMIGAIHGAIGAADLRQLLCLTPATAATPLVAPWSTTQALVLADISSHSGTYSELERQRDDSLRQYALDLGTTPLA